MDIEKITEDNLLTNYIYKKIYPLSNKIKAFIIEAGLDKYIIINSNISINSQKKALFHEIAHIELQHFKNYTAMNLKDADLEVEQLLKFLNDECLF